ncbi:hypothetical protein [Sphingomonas glacialis]|nr:hypothetical protein [Sphingomonas glacialis]
MRRQAMMTVRGLAVSMMLTSGAIASAPPAPPVFIDELATRIVPTQSAASFDAYCATFANDLTVTVDGKRIAGNKAAWVAAEHHRLGKVDRFVVGFAEGYDALLVIERYDDRSDLPVSPSVLFDPRYKARAVRYAVGPDHLIHTIQIAETDGVFQVPK